VGGVAAEVTQKILVLLQHQHVNPPARQQHSGDHSGRSAATMQQVVASSRMAMYLSHWYGLGSSSI
jgi:hypothetical protein